MVTARGESACLPGDAEHAAAVSLFNAMAHEGRLRVLVALSRLGPLNVTALVEHSRMEQSALSHQLRFLKEARLVSSERAGKNVIYALTDGHIRHVVEDAIAHAAEHDGVAARKGRRSAARVTKAEAPRRAGAGPAGAGGRSESAAAKRTGRRS